MNHRSPPPKHREGGLREDMFDHPTAYDSLLNQGLRLSGESRQYFAKCRVEHLIQFISDGPAPSRILDFGCGTGDTSALLAAKFAGAEVIGVDSSEAVIASANERFGGRRVRFAPVSRMPGIGTFDLAYMNGVLHHISPTSRLMAMYDIAERLRPGGHLMIFENNPFSPAARWVMRRIPFDREAILVWPHEAARLIRDVGLLTPHRTRYFFIFPRALRLLRPFEARLSGLPFGAQYLVIGRRPGPECREP